MNRSSRSLVTNFQVASVSPIFIFASYTRLNWLKSTFAVVRSKLESTHLPWRVPVYSLSSDIVTLELPLVVKYLSSVLTVNSIKSSFSIVAIGVFSPWPLNVVDSPVVNFVTVTVTPPCAYSDWGFPSLVTWDFKVV